MLQRKAIFDPKARLKGTFLGQALLTFSKPKSNQISELAAATKVESTL